MGLNRSPHLKQELLSVSEIHRWVDPMKDGLDKLQKSVIEISNGPGTAAELVQLFEVKGLIVNFGDFPWQNNAGFSLAFWVVSHVHSGLYTGSPIYAVIICLGFLFD